MKKFILLSTFLFTSHLAFSNNEPVFSEATFEIKEIGFKMSALDYDVYATDISYDIKNSTINFNTNSEVSFLQILDEDGQLQYQLPVFSKSIILDLEDFENGNYKLNLLMNNKSVVPTEFTK